MGRRKAVFQRVGQFVARDQHIHHHHWPESAPPDDPDVARPCPQCKRLTWRYTAACMYCGLRVQAWHTRQRLLAFLRAPIHWVMRRCG